MTLIVELPDSDEAMLKAKAEAEGLSAEQYVRQVIERDLMAGAPRQHLSVEQWSMEFEQWADSFPEAAPIPDEALRRENLYPDRV